MGTIGLPTWVRAATGYGRGIAATRTTTLGPLVEIAPLRGRRRRADSRGRAEVLVLNGADANRAAPTRRGLTAARVISTRSGSCDPRERANDDQGCKDSSYSEHRNDACHLRYFLSPTRTGRLLLRPGRVPKEYVARSLLGSPGPHCFLTNHCRAIALSPTSFLSQNKTDYPGSPLILRSRLRH